MPVRQASRLRSHRGIGPLRGIIYMGAALASAAALHVAVAASLLTWHGPRPGGAGTAGPFELVSVAQQPAGQGPVRQDEGSEPAGPPEREATSAREGAPSAMDPSSAPETDTPEGTSQDSRDASAQASRKGSDAVQAHDGDRAAAGPHRERDPDQPSGTAADPSPDGGQRQGARSSEPARAGPPAAPASAGSSASAPAADQGGDRGDDDHLIPPDAGADYLDNPRPRYPMRARRRGLEGTVLVSVQVDRQGEPVAVDVAQSSGHAILDRAARRAVQRWRFAPARRRGEPVAAEVTIPVRFTLAQR